MAALGHGGRRNYACTDPTPVIPTCRTWICLTVDDSPVADHDTFPGEETSPISFSALLRRAGSCGLSSPPQPFLVRCQLTLSTPLTVCFLAQRLEPGL